MWKLSMDKDTIYKNIKEKRKCVDINMGFLYQLSKWEEFLKVNKELKFYRIGEEGIVTLVDRSDELHTSTFSILLLLQNGKFYKIINQDVPKECLSKVDEFIELLQKYENYPNELCQIYIDGNLLDKGILNGL
jgi:hypothetical protein